MRVAIVHDWLTGMRGGERVLEAMLTLYPAAEIFTLVHVPGAASPAIEQRPIHTSFIDRITRTRFRPLLPLFPLALRGLRPEGFDVVLSSSHCVAKSVRVPPGVPHLCYCHTPMRYVWDQYDAYFGPGRAPLMTRLAMRALAPLLRSWDAKTADRPTRFVANSQHVRARIRRHYNREAAVLYPPVDVQRFRPAAARDDFYLIVSALVPYKRIDLAVAAFNGLGRPLLIVGDGPERTSLERAAGPHVAFAGHVPDGQVEAYMAKCRAFVMPGEEDFGIAVVEAQAAGAPVIAYARGGALETVRGDATGASIGADATGVFFTEPSPDSLARAVRALDGAALDTAAIVDNAQRFAPDRFLAGLRAEIDEVLA